MNHQLLKTIIYARPETTRCAQNVLREAELEVAGARIEVVPAYRFLLEY